MSNIAGPTHPAFKHGKTRTRIYQIWQNMHQRCYNSNSPEYKRYGGRGICVAKRWHDFELFYTDVGDPPDGKSFDRIDTNKDYKPTNWRWATPYEQAQNRRNTRLLTFDGATVSLNSWAQKVGLNRGTLQQRLEMGIPIERALNRKPIPKIKIHTEEILLKMLTEGASIAKIARDLGVTRRTVRRRKSGIKNLLNEKPHKIQDGP